jgi:hypothetical protein
VRSETNGVREAVSFHFALDQQEAPPPLAMGKEEASCRANVLQVGGLPCNLRDHRCSGVLPGECLVTGLQVDES